MAPLGRPRNHERRLDALRNLELPSRGWVLLTLAGAAVVWWLGWTALKTNFYRSAIPPKIGLTFGLATTGSSLSLLEAMLPIRHEACGGAIFGLTDVTAQAIRKQGIAFLKDARQGRGYADRSDRLYYYYAYEEWQPTPLPDGWVSENLLGLWYGLACMELSRDFAQSIGAAAAAPGSLYAVAQSKMLMVIPSLGLVVYTYSN